MTQNRRTRSYERVLRDLRDRMAIGKPNLPAEIGLALICVVISTLGRLWMQSMFGDQAPFITFLPAILISTFFGGLRCGIMTLGVLAVIGWYLFLPPYFSWRHEPRQLGVVTIFVAAGGIVILVSHMLRRAMIDLQRARMVEGAMAAELQHRVKNTLAVVQAIAAQTQRTTDSPAAFTDAFSSRLHALSRAHDLMSRTAWAGASVEAVVRDTLAPFLENDGAGVTIGGPDIATAPELSVALALCLHELATNATKYGALSTPEGRLSVHWRREGTAARLIWEESDGPSVAAPSRRGFGTRLLERGLAPFSGKLERLEYRPEGLVCELTFET